MTKKITAFFLALVVVAVKMMAQDAAAPAPAPASPISISGFVGSYFAWDNDKSVKAGQDRQLSFIAPRKESFGVDVAMISAKYGGSVTRGVVTLQLGDGARLWGSGGAQAYENFIQEGYAGVLLAKNLWLDGGFFLTHIGAEGFFPKDNYLSTLALTTLYEPFGQAGLRLSYAFSDKFTSQVLLLNGYSNLNDNNSQKAVAIQFDYKPNDNFEILYDNLFGHDVVGIGADQFRFYNNLVLKVYPSSKFEFLVGVDYAFQTKTKLDTATGDLGNANYFSLLLSSRLKVTRYWNVMLRGEYFMDGDGVFGTVRTTDNSISGLKAFGVTGGFEYRPMNNGFLRFESRFLSADSKQKRFQSGNNEAVNSRVEVVTTFGVTF
jgi:hypothetical protein